MEARLVELRHLAKFRPLNDVPNDLLPTKGEVTIRLPTKLITYGTQMTFDTKDTNDSTKPIDPRRLHPPFFPDGLPGFLVSYEQLVRDAKGNQLAYTLYIAAEKLGPEGAEKRNSLEETLLKKLQAGLPGL